MTIAVADTHAVIWYIWADPRSDKARAIIDVAAARGEQISVPTICLIEMVYLVEKQRIDPTTTDRVLAILSQRNVFREEPFLRSMIPSLRGIDRSQISDLPDRVIAATASYLNVPLLSRDGKIQASSVSTIW
jgi:PIN domain nuclease of toxin-antitoxin system